ncbi:MAG: UDP-glucose--hexose-1-phosphate uridylyltransferase [Bryobacterales bacterium]|nr:UDP-glucose--hexose-1-phosphate uridylyltransferase [Bryobacterales bacterium]
MSLLADAPHRRYNALTGDWVIVSPHRTKRPWQGQVERVPHPTPISHDPSCYLCPGNERAGGHRNPAYDSTFVFDNDFAALLPTGDPFALNIGLLRARSERGLCRVLCFSPHHGLTVSRMTGDALSLVVAAWGAQFRELSALDFVRAVQIFENRGEMMGASNPHPHCQIWAIESLPLEHTRELEMQSAHRAKRGSCLLCDYLSQELHEAERIVCENDSFVALVPFWAVWPFETLLLPRRHMAAIDELTPAEQRGLANIMRRLTTRYDNLFECPFPYSMGFHQRPTDGGDHPHVHLHAHYYPPLLRSATVRKFMVGFEMLGGPARDITPESAAERLRAAGELHYLDQPESVTPESTA